MLHVIINGDAVIWKESNREMALLYGKNVRKLETIINDSSHLRLICVRICDKIYPRYG